MIFDKDLQSIQEARRLVEKASDAEAVLAQYSQQQIDAVVAACAEAARRNAEGLARLAVEETTYGNVPDKIDKTLFSARDVYNAIKNLKTVGIIRDDAQNGVVEIAVPCGVVAAIIPCTNPTSTAVFKALIALKGRNTIVMSPHPSAVRCISETVRVMYEAALQAGAPEGCIACLSDPTMEATEELMRHPRTAIILATGGAGLVRAAYSSGKPALGVGPGNVPAYIHTSANISKAVADIFKGKTFDYGTICSSEQHMVVDQAIAGEVRAESERQGGFFLTAEQAAAVARVLILPNFRVNAKMVGQPPQRIAQEADISIPAGARVLIAPLEGVGKKYPLSAEKLSPVLSFYPVKDWHEGLDVCTRLLQFGGAGHTMAIHANDDKVIRELALQLPAFRLVVNTPATHGSIGYTTNLFPSMSLGCGTLGGNITSDNISPMHLVNIKRLAYERRPVTHSERAAASGPALSQQQGGRAGVQGSASSASSGTSIRPAPAVQHEISRIVQRFLEARSKASANTRTSQSASAEPRAPQIVPSAAPDPRHPGYERAATDTTIAPHAAPDSNPRGVTPDEKPTPRPVSFVCEEDVRQAIRKGEKIYIAAKTIVTPSARDLGEPREIFVLVKS